MTATATSAPEVTYVVEISFDAFTMDRTASWDAVERFEPFHSEQAAEDAKIAYGNENEWFDGEAFMRVRKVVAPRPEQGYSDPFMEAEFAANAQYWSDRARAAEVQQEAQREMFRCYGKGAVVKVTGGRKVPVGTEGTVFWIGEDKFSRVGAHRVGFKDSAGETFWSPIANIESVTPAFEKEA